MNYLRCKQSGLHQDEQLELVCLNKDCILSNKHLNCIICIEEDHFGHQVIPLDKLMNLVRSQEHSLRDLLNQQSSNIHSQQQQQNAFRRYDELIIEFDQISARFSSNIEAIKQIIYESKNTMKMLTYEMPSYDAFKQASTAQNNNLCQKIIKRILLSLEFNSKAQELQLRELTLKDEMDDNKENIFYFSHLKSISESLNSILGQLTGALKQQPTQINLVNSNRSISIPKFDYPIEQTTSNYFSNSRKFCQSVKSNFVVTKSNFAGTKSNFAGTKSNFVNNEPNDCILSASLNSFKQILPKSKLFQPLPNTTQLASIMSSLQNITSSYLFSDEYIGNGIEVFKNGLSAKLILELDKVLVLIKPAIYGSGVTREITVRLKIIVNKIKIIFQSNAKIQISDIQWLLGFVLSLK